MVISICKELHLIFLLIKGPADFIIFAHYWAPPRASARNYLFPFQSACASGDSRLRQLVEDVASCQCECTAFFTTITSTKFASPHMRIKDFTPWTLSEAVHRTGQRRLSLCFLWATSSVDNGSGEVCRFTRLRLAGAETRIMAGQLGRRCILYLAAKLCR